MLQALLDDLAELPQVEVLTSRDARLPPLTSSAEVVRIGRDEDAWQCWERCIRQADALWPIAPESGGVLERLSGLAMQHGKCLLGSLPQAVAQAASKRKTLAALCGGGVAVAPTFRPQEIFPGWLGPWVGKPDDGVGCEDTRRFADTAALTAWLRRNGRMRSHIVQPYLPGTAASLSMICRGGEAWLLSCNRQLVDLQEDRFSYHGSVLNGMAQHWEDFQRIAGHVARAIPGLAGYVGVDVLVDEGEITVLEVNPRLTTSYAGLRRAMGCNPARLVLDLLYNGDFQFPPIIAHNVVEISLDE